MIQAIVCGEGQAARLSGHRFMDKYIFLGGEVPRLEALLSVIKKEGFSLENQELLDPHYFLTLKAWLRNLEEKKEE